MSHQQKQQCGRLNVQHSRLSLLRLPPSLYLSRSSLRSRIPSRNPSEMLQEKLVNDEATSLEVKRLPPLY
ncbi:hypothetical protein NQZ68_031186 [Dissostichus eleginoides]|nr:hypothetical protein NQZ68_031186 [Dissostichus eleginoides]